MTGRSTVLFTWALWQWGLRHWSGFKKGRKMQEQQQQKGWVIVMKHSMIAPLCIFKWLKIRDSWAVIGSLLPELVHGFPLDKLARDMIGELIYKESSVQRRKTCCMSLASYRWDVNSLPNSPTTPQEISESFKVLIHKGYIRIVC